MNNPQESCLSTEAEVRQGVSGDRNGVEPFRTFGSASPPTPGACEGPTPVDCTDTAQASTFSGALNAFHRLNFERQHEAFAPPHSLMALVACVHEEGGELAAAVLGFCGEKKRKAHLTREDVLDAVADSITYLSLVASNVGCFDLEKLLGDTFNMVSRRANSNLFTDLGQPAPPVEP